MDPNTVLNIMLDRSKVIVDAALEGADMGAIADEAVELAEAVQNLNEWIAKGGFLPAAWEKKDK